jgi:hypothetical protein
MIDFVGAGRVAALGKILYKKSPDLNRGFFISQLSAAYFFAVAIDFFAASAT